MTEADLLVQARRTGPAAVTEHLDNLASTIWTASGRFARRSEQEAKPHLCMATPAMTDPPGMWKALRTGA